jgi:hypothetical protein
VPNRLWHKTFKTSISQGFILCSKLKYKLLLSQQPSQKALVFSVASWQNPPESLMNEIFPAGEGLQAGVVFEPFPGVGDAD